MPKSSLRFKTLCDDVLVYSKKHHRDHRRVVHRMNRIVPTFGELQADAIKPVEIDVWLSEYTKTPATSNRYRALFSLIFRKALGNGKVIRNLRSSVTGIKTRVPIREMIRCFWRPDSRGRCN